MKKSTILIIAEVATIFAATTAAIFTGNAGIDRQYLPSKTMTVDSESPFTNIEVRYADSLWQQRAENWPNNIPFDMEINAISISTDTGIQAATVALTDTTEWRISATIENQKLTLWLSNLNVKAHGVKTIPELDITLPAGHSLEVVDVNVSILERLCLERIKSENLTIASGYKLVASDCDIATLYILPGNISHSKEIEFNNSTIGDIFVMPLVSELSVTGEKSTVDSIYWLDNLTFDKEDGDPTPTRLQTYGFDNQPVIYVEANPRGDQSENLWISNVGRITKIKNLNNPKDTAQ